MEGYIQTVGLILASIPHYDKTGPFSASLLAWFAFGSAGAAEKASERVVAGNTITSARDPAVRIELPKSVQYVGNARWDLYDVADCEVHVFVEADEQKLVQRLYWIQFEAYLPSNTHSYKYKFEEKLTHAGLEFDVRARFGPTNNPPKPGSDLERVMALLEKGGFRAPAEMMNVRLVHLPDEAKRKELMLIYAEDLAPTGSTLAEIESSAPGGEARWLELKPKLIERALENIRIKTAR